MGSYYAIVLTRAWRNWVAFVKTQILVSLAGALVTTMVTGPVSAGVGEKFNVQVALYAAVIAALVVAGCGLAWQLIVIPRRRHDEQAPRLREFELRVEVGRATGAPCGLRSRSVSSPPRGTETRESSHPAIDYPPPGVVCSRARTHFGSTGTRERRWTEPMPTLDDLETPDIEYN